MNKRLLWLIVIIILLLSSFNVILQIKHSLSKKKSIREEIVAVNKKIEEIKADIEKYDKKIASLDDEFEKEKVARNMFQMVKENEVIYKYVEKNNNKTGIGLRIMPYLWGIFGAIVLFLFFGIFGIIFFIILDWVNIAREKNFEWSMRYGYSSYLSILMNIMFVVNLIVIGSAEYESSIIPFLLYSQLIFQFVFFNIILFVKMVVTTNIRYKRLRKFSKQILDAFILEK